MPFLQGFLLLLTLVTSAGATALAEDDAAAAAEKQAAIPLGEMHLVWLGPDGEALPGILYFAGSDDVAER